MDRPFEPRGIFWNLLMLPTLRKQMKLMFSFSFRDFRKLLSCFSNFSMYRNCFVDCESGKQLVENKWMFSYLFFVWYQEVAQLLPGNLKASAVLVFANFVFGSCFVLCFLLAHATESSWRILLCLPGLVLLFSVGLKSPCLLWLLLISLWRFSIVSSCPVTWLKGTSKKKVAQLLPKMGQLSYFSKTNDMNV